jgi:hypothetical protein
MNAKMFLIGGSSRPQLRRIGVDRTAEQGSSRERLRGPPSLAGGSSRLLSYPCHRRDDPVCGGTPVAPMTDRWRRHLSRRRPSTPSSPSIGRARATACGDLQAFAVELRRRGALARGVSEQDAPTPCTQASTSASPPNAAERNPLRRPHRMHPQSSPGRAVRLNRIALLLSRSCERARPTPARTCSGRGARVPPGSRLALASDAKAIAAE